MFQILSMKYLNENIFRMDIEAPMVARACLPGQFVIVRSHEDAERIPLTICDYDREKGSVTIVVQVIGAGTIRMPLLGIHTEETRRERDTCTPMLITALYNSQDMEAT